MNNYKEFNETNLLEFEKWYNKIGKKTCRYSQGIYEYFGKYMFGGKDIFYIDSDKEARKLVWEELAKVSK